jgi:hypothetical protein
LVTLEAKTEVRKLVLQPLLVGEMPSGMKEDDQEEDLRRRLHCLLERFMASFGPASRFVYDMKKTRSHPCAVYTMKVSVNKARVSWSHRTSRRFFQERRGPAFRISLFRAVEYDQVEPVAQKSIVPGEPDRLGFFRAPTNRGTKCVSSTAIGTWLALRDHRFRGWRWL